ncbi:MAG: tetratricopeptide repeat protein [bacterium]|nr:tetratricopeptide repeat protein [bacterium]
MLPFSLHAPTARARLLAPLLMLSLLGAMAPLGCGGSREAQLEEIRALQDAGLYAESVEPLREFLSTDPGQPEANYRLGTALLRTGQASPAVWPLHRAAASEAYAVPAGLALALTLQEQNQREEALEAANRVLEVEPDNERALMIRVQVSLATAHPEEALADTDRLLEISPDRYLGLRASALADLGRLDEAEQIYSEAAGKAEQLDPSSAAQWCIVMAEFLGEKREDAERASEQLERCLEPNPAAPAVVRRAVELYDKMDRPEQAMATVRRAVETEPNDLGLRKSLADRLVAADKVDEADAQLREAAETLETPAAWFALAEMRRRADKPELAREAIERAREISPEDPEELRFFLADLLAELGELEEAERLAATLEQPAFRQIAQGRILLERGESAEALTALGLGIQAWPNNTAARLLAAEAALDLGDTERAMVELREATRLSAEENNAALLLGRLYLARGNFDSAVALLLRHVAAQGFADPEAHVLLASAEAQRGRLDQARGWLEKLRSHEAFEGRAVAERARLEQRVSGAQVALKVLEGSGLDLTDPRHEPAARQWIGLLLAEGQGEKARAWADQVKESDSPDLQALRGDLLFQLGEDDAARAVFEAALQADAESGPALAGLGQLEQRAGNAEAALTLYEKARAAHSGNPHYAYLAASAQLALGRNEEGESGLRALLRRNPEYFPACNDLAWLLAEQGKDLDLAIELATRAARFNPGAEVLDTLGWVRLKSGQIEPAVAAFEMALTKEPDNATARYHLGMALVKRGDAEAAQQAFRAALDAGPFAESEAARQELERLAADVGARP